MKPIYKFALSDTKTTGYYYIDTDGSVVASDTIVYVKEMVDSANFIEQLKRHPRYYGVFQYYTPERVRFCEDMATIIRYVYNKEDISGQLFLRVEVINTTTQLYDLMGIFQLDLSNSNSQLLYAEANVAQGGAAMDLTGYEDTICEIPLTAHTDMAHLDGVSLLGTYHYESEEGNICQMRVHGLGDNRASSTFGMAYVDHEGDVEVGDAQGVLYNTDIPNGPFADAWFFKVTNDADFTINWQMDLTYTLAYNPNSSVMPVPNAILRLKYRAYDTNSLSATPVFEGVLWESNGGAWQTANVLDQPESQLITYNRTELAGRWMVMYFDLETDAFMETDNEVLGTVYIEGRHIAPINLQYLRRADYTLCRTLTGYELFKDLALKLGSGYEAQSSLLQSNDLYHGIQPATLRYTCGDAIRQLYTDTNGNASDPVIKTSMKDFAYNCFVKLGAGIGIEMDEHGNEYLRMELLSYFYRTGSPVMDLGLVIGEEYTMEPYNDYRGNNIKAGFKDQTLDTLNGKYEYNVGQAYRTNVGQKMQELDYTSPYRGDCYGIELCRYNLANKTTTDSESDNDVFMLQCRTTLSSLGGYILDRRLTITAGVPASVAISLFNVPLTGKHDMLRLLPWLLANYGGGLLRINSKISFQSGDKNTLLVSTNPDATSTAENADIDLSAATVAPLFVAKKISALAEVSKEVMAAVTANPYGEIKMKIKGVDVYGFLLEIGRNAQEEAPYNVQILMSPTTVLPDNF